MVESFIDDQRVDSVAWTYLLDTCVLPADPNCVLRFDEHDAVLPLVVVEELEPQEDTVPVDELATGVVEVPSAGETIDELFDHGKLEIGDVAAVVNDFVVLRSGVSRSAVAASGGVCERTVVERVATTIRAFGVEPKNLRQSVALHHLLDPEIPAVSLMGMAGSGKSQSPARRTGFTTFRRTPGRPPVCRRDIPR